MIQGNTVALGIGGGVGIVIDTGPLNVPATSNVLIGNLIGTNAGSTPLGNDVGIYLNNVSGNVIGGTTSSDQNVISTSQNVGVELFGTAATGNTIDGNQIGAPAGTIVRGFDPFHPSVFSVAGTLGNGVGVFIDGSSGNTIANNLIAGNFQAGLFAFDGAKNTVEGNQIENNGGYGVILFNSPGNPDPRLGNTLQGNNAGNFHPFVGPDPSTGNSIMSVSTLVGKATHATASTHAAPAVVKGRQASHVARNFRARSARHGH